MSQFSTQQRRASTGRTQLVRKRFSCAWCANVLGDHFQHTYVFGVKKPSDHAQPWYDTFWLCPEHVAYFDERPEWVIGKLFPNSHCAECDSPCHDDYLCIKCRSL